jgi:hypothetical protein
MDPHSKLIKTPRDIEIHIIPTLRNIQTGREMFYEGNLDDPPNRHIIEATYRCGCGHSLYKEGEEMEDPFDVNESEAVRDYEGLFLSFFNERVRRDVRTYLKSNPLVV